LVDNSSILGKNSSILVKSQKTLILPDMKGISPEASPPVVPVASPRCLSPPVVVDSPIAFVASPPCISPPVVVESPIAFNAYPPCISPPVVVDSAIAVVASPRFPCCISPPVVVDSPVAFVASPRFPCCISPPVVCVSVSTGEAPVGDNRSDSRDTARVFGCQSSVPVGGVEGAVHTSAAANPGHHSQSLSPSPTGNPSLIQDTCAYVPNVTPPSPSHSIGSWHDLSAGQDRSTPMFAASFSPLLSSPPSSPVAPVPTIRYPVYLIRPGVFKLHYSLLDLARDALARLLLHVLELLEEDNYAPLEAFFLFPATIGGKEVTVAQARARLARWQDITPTNIVEEILEWGHHNTTPQARRPHLSASKALPSRKVDELLRAGCPRKALRTFESAIDNDILPPTVDVVNKIQKLFPKAPPTPLHIPVGPPPPVLSVDEVLAAVRSSPTQTAQGLSAWTYDLLKLMTKGGKGSMVGELYCRLMNLRLRGEAGPNCYWCSPRVIALGKKHKPGAVRPISITDANSRMLARILCAKYIHLATAALQPIQMGVGVSAGADILVHNASLAATMAFSEYQLEDPFCLSGYDMRNGYGEINRSAILSGILELLPEPGLLSYFEHTYGAAVQGYMSDGTEVCSIQTGIVQGDPLGPLLFCLGFHPVLTALKRDFPNTDIMAYMDDVYTGQHASNCMPFQQAFTTKAAAVGLHINDKTQHSSDASTITVLGAPQGEPEAVSEAIQNSLAVISVALPHLPKLPPDTAFTLLCTCVANRGRYMARMLNPKVACDPFKLFDTSVDNCIQAILNQSTPLSSLGAAVRHLPARHGGLGIPRLARENPDAYYASLLPAMEHTPGVAPATHALFMSYPYLFSDLWSETTHSARNSLQPHYIQSDALCPACWQEDIYQQPVSFAGACETRNVLEARTLFTHYPPNTLIGKLLDDFTFQGSASIARNNGMLAHDDPNRLLPEEFQAYVSTRLFYTGISEGVCGTCGSNIGNEEEVVHRHSKCTSRTNKDLRKALSDFLAHHILFSTNHRVLLGEERCDHKFDMVVLADDEEWLIELLVGSSVQVKRPVAAKAALTRRWSPILEWYGREEGIHRRYFSFFVSPAGRVCPEATRFLNKLAIANGIPPRVTKTALSAIVARHAY
jgi:hypothetical protein